MGARSHSSGGGSSRSSFGGGSSSRSHSSRSYGMSRGSHHISHYNGRGYHHSQHHGYHGYYATSTYRGPVSTILTLIIMIVIAFSFVGFLYGAIDRCKSTLREVEVSYHKYQDMIDNAKIDETKKIKAKITYIGYDEKYERYYLEYAIYSSNHRFPIHENSTFAMYDYNDWLQLNVGDEIDVALNNSSVTLATDSINMDYENISLDEDAEYIYYKDAITNNEVAIYITYFVVGILTITLIVTIIKAIKDTKKDKKENATELPLPSQTITNTNKYCEYCGGKLPENADKCPLCGARTK